MTNVSTLYRGGVLHCPADPSATALLVSGGRIIWLGPDADAPAGEQAANRRLRLQLLQAQREELLRLRDLGTYSSATLRQALAELDAAQIGLEIMS